MKRLDIHFHIISVSSQYLIKASRIREQPSQTPQVEIKKHPSRFLIIGQRKQDWVRYQVLTTALCHTPQAS